MHRRLIPITRRLFSSNLPKDSLPNQPKPKPEFDVFDYAGHKFSYEHKKNYGQYDVQQLWGDRVIFANDKETLKQKRKDNIITTLLLVSLTTCGVLMFQIETEMLDASRAVLKVMYKNFDK